MADDFATLEELALNLHQDILLNPEENEDPETPVDEPGNVQTKSDTYFPININLPAQDQPTTNTTVPLTEEQKRKRMMIILGSLFVAVLILVIVMAIRNSNK
jgi:hypothetical protein